MISLLTRRHQAGFVDVGMWDNNDGAECRELMLARWHLVEPVGLERFRIMSPHKG